jgi:hypothetical protein
MCANKSGLSKPYHAASLPCGAQEGECCSWISNFLGLEEISHPTFLPCPVCAMSKQKSPDTVHRNQHYKKQHQHAAAGHSRNTVACYGTDTMLELCLYTKLKKKSGSGSMDMGVQWHNKTSVSSLRPKTFTSLPLKNVPDDRKNILHINISSTGLHTYKSG